MVICESCTNSYSLTKPFPYYPTMFCTRIISLLLEVLQLSSPCRFRIEFYRFPSYALQSRLPPTFTSANRSLPTLLWSALFLILALQLAIYERRNREGLLY